MKTYIGTKTIKAEPAIRVDGKVYLLSESYPKTLNAEHGYKVVYGDGYESFSPKDVFEKAYRLAETPLDRLDIERKELDAKCYALFDFIIKKNFDELPTLDQVLLKTQLNHMSAYLDVLNYRHDAMSGSTPHLRDMSFNRAFVFLKQGCILRRNGWEQGLVVFRQVPARISKEIIPKMQSLPEEAKKHILAHTGFINYNSQCLIYNTNTGEANSWSPSVDDIFAYDWELVINEDTKSNG